jgi:hypothetical protein
MGSILAVPIALSLAAIAAPGLAQTLARTEIAAAAPSRYDIRREVAIEGTVAGVVTKPSPGMLAGAHVLLAISSGTVDAHLGNYAMTGANALSLVLGERIKVVGVMTTVQGKPVFIVRTLQAGGNVHVIRSRQGFPVRWAPAGSAGRLKAPERGRP